MIHRNKINYLFSNSIKCNILQRQFSASYKLNSQLKSYDEVPGPKPAPIFGFLWHCLPKVGRYYGVKRYDLHVRLQKDYGNIIRLRNLPFHNDLLLIYDPNDIETVFRNEGPWPKRDILNSIKYYRQHLKKDIFNGYGGVFCCDDKEWQDARSVQNSVLMQPRTVKMYFEKMVEVSEDFLKRIRYLSEKDANNEMPADFFNELNKWALESVGIITLNQRFGTLSTDKLPSDIQNFINDIHAFFDHLVAIDIEPSLSKFISTPGWRRFVATHDRITEFLLKQVDTAKKRIAKDDIKNKELRDMDMIERLIKTNNEKFILSNTMDILLGGVDTTSRTIAGILYFLSANPEAQENLRKEVLSVFPNKDTEITSDKLELMPYNRAVIKESLRISPISVGVSRLTSKDLNLSGYFIPKGTDVMIEQIPLLWSEEYFPNASEFRPERWLRTDSKGVDINPWVHLPFGFGPRSCVGRRIAQMEMEILTSQIVRNFKLEWHQGEPEYDQRLFYGIVSPLKYRMIPINN